MTLRIEPYAASHLDAVIRLSLRAWAPVFESLQAVIDPDVFNHLYSAGWRACQEKAVTDVCADAGNVWVAVENNTVAGFVAIKLNTEAKLGEIYMIAVDPDFQKRGIGATLTNFALTQLKEAGMVIAMVETGGDPGHASARSTYEKAGFGLLPISRYFRKL